MSLIYDIGLDTAHLERDVRRANLLFKNIGDQAEMQSNKVDSSFRNAFAFAGGTAAATAFVKQLVSVRGEFQQLEIAFTTMLKSKERSDALMKDVTEFAATTPFDLKQVAAGTKQLLAYGFTADSIKDNLSMLGNVASGVGSQISDVIYLYGTLKASGRVTQMDINQFAGRGIPIYEELARVLGVNVDQVRSFVSEGKVGFAEVEKAFQGMTNESGMFYNLMQEQSKSITGQISNLGDSIDTMFNNIGKSSQGFISDSISGVAFLVENYETVGKVIAGLIGTYGAYKAAVITLTAIQKAQTLIQLESALAGRALTTAQGLQAISAKALSAAQLALNKTMLANPYVLVATVVIGLAAAMWTLHDSTTAAEKAQKRYNEEKQLAADLETKHKEEIEKLIETATNQALADGERVGALQALKVKYPEIFKQYDIEKLKLADILAIKKQIAEEDAKGKTQKNKENLQALDSQIQALEKEINSTIVDEYNSDIVARKEKRLQELKSKRGLYQKDVDSDNANAFLSSVTGLSNTKLEVEIKRRENLIAQLGGSKKYAQVQGLGTFSKDELKAQLDSLKTERENRNKELLTGSQELAKANKELADKTKERNAILTAKLTPEDRAKQLADIDSQIEAVNKKIKLLGGKSKTDSKKANTEAKKDTQDFEAERLRQIENANKAELDLFRSKITDKKDLIDLDYEQQIMAINKAEREFKEKAKNAGVANPDLSIFDKQREMAGQKRVSDKQSVDTEALESALSAYKTLLQRKEDLDKEYEKNKIILAGNPESLKALSAQYKTELESLQSDLLNDSGVGILDLYLFGDGEQFIQEKIKLAFPELKNLSQLTIEELNKVRSFVDTIGFTDEQLKSFEELGINVDDLIKKLNEAKESENGFLDETKWNSILDLANQIAGSVGQLGSSLEGFGGAIGEVGGALSGLSSQVGNITSIFKKGATKGDIISGGISGLADLIGMVANQIAENKKAQEEWNSKIEEGKHQMALMRIEAEGYKEANLFGVENPYARAIAGAKQYAQSTKELYDATKKLEGGQVQTGTKKVVKGENVASGVGSGAAVGAAIGTAIGGWAFGIGTIVGAGIGALVGGIVGLASKETVPVFENLKKKYGEVVDSQGNLNKQVLADYSKMDDATKQLIDNWEDIKAKQEEAQALMKQNFSDLAGDLGTSLSDALVDAFKNDKLYSAIDKFDSKMNDVISGIVSQLIFNSIFGQMFTDLENKFNDSFSAGGDQSIVDELLWFNENYKKNMEAYNQAMELANSEMKNSGLTGFENADPRTATTKGFAQASQDSISELNGRFTAVQGHTFRIAESVEMLRANSGQALKHLAGIESNTSRLEAVENGILSIKSGIDTINLKGVKLQ